jgi:hypothetical protein
MTFDYNKLRELRDSVQNEIKNLTKTLIALNTILDHNTAVAPKAKSPKRRKSQWHVCPVGCGSKHRLSHEHMKLEKLPEAASTAFASTTHAA